MKSSYVVSAVMYLKGNEAPEKCPQCGAPKEKFTEMKAGVKEYADEHVVGIAKGVDERILEGLHLNFTGECSEVGMYLAMSRVADRQGYPEVAEAYKRIAFEEAEHAAKFAELLGEVVTPTQRPTLNSALLLNRVLALAKKNWQPLLNSSTSMLSMTRSMKWQKMKLAMAAYSMACSLVTLQNKLDTKFSIPFPI